MKILCDSREHKGKNNHVLQYFRDNKIEFEEGIAFSVGDYREADNPKLVIDRKQSLNEVYSNLIQSHERFKRECLRAIEQGVVLIILIEEEKCKCLDDVA
jgi:predicted SnoaL-like aldol condensation-catalyzing enzyme